MKASDSCKIQVIKIVMRSNFIKSRNYGFRRIRKSRERRKFRYSFCIPERRSLNRRKPIERRKFDYTYSFPERRDGGRFTGDNRRQFQYTIHIPARRKDTDRRSGGNRRRAQK